MKHTVTQGRQVVEHRPEEILILKGLPAEYFSVVAIHELTHAWIAFQGIMNLPLKDEEGLCSLMEYLWLKDLCTPEALFRRKQLQQSDDPIYGRGYRNAKAAMKQHTFPTLLNHILRYRRLPRVGLLGKMWK